jgi:HEPN domain-containing protein
LHGQEFLIAGEIFDSVLEQAKYLVTSGYKDPAAILARVILEDALKRLARGEGIDDTLRASRINDELKAISKYSQPQWRLIQAWLDIGNAAAHGKFDEYSREYVVKLLEGVGGFVASIFHV